MMRALSTRLLLPALLMVLAASSCGYDPQPAQGLLKCAPDNSCPEGYMCSTASGYCFKNGTCHPLQSSVDKMVGRWTFVMPSRRQITCSDGSAETDKMWTDYFDVDVGGSSAVALQSYYYCPLDLQFDTFAAPDTTVLVPGVGCSAPDMKDPTITYTWEPQTCSLAPPDGCRGTLTASIPFTADTSSGTITCTMDFTGTLVKS